MIGTSCADDGGGNILCFNPYDSSKLYIFQYQAGRYFNGNLVGLKYIGVIHLQTNTGLQFSWY